MLWGVGVVELLLLLQSSRLRRLKGYTGLTGCERPVVVTRGSSRQGVSEGTRTNGMKGRPGGDSIAGNGIDLQGPTSTAEALLVLAVIVTVHECGHFLAARLQNIHVSQFAIGFGPSIFTYKVPQRVQTVSLPVCAPQRGPSNST